jgi:hypothetical protein
VNFSAAAKAEDKAEDLGIVAVLVVAVRIRSSCRALPPFFLYAEAEFV